MRRHLERHELPQQTDAFAAPSIPQPQPQRPEQPRSLGFLLPRSALDASELWLAVHLPQLSQATSLDEPGESHRRQRLLERLAFGALSFTPRVSLAPPDGLLLEIGGSLKLFSGVESLCERLTQAHRAMRVESMLAVAPTPLAALACARVRHRPLMTDRARLVGSLASLPLSALRWPLDTIARLAKVGVYTVGQALRLPRVGFAKRFGAMQLASLDRLVGRIADPQPRFHPRERFRRRRELSYEIESSEAILHALQPLLQELETFLSARQAGITRLECRFRHRHALPTVCALQLAVPAADARRFGVLLGERLSTVALPEPVRSCELRTDVVIPIAQACAPMWQPGEHGGAVSTEEGARLVEHLRARLSAQAVYGLKLVSDHRPEKAWRIVEPALLRRQGETFAGTARRPLWLLSSPLRLEEHAGWPWYRGRLELCCAARKERIEASHGDARAIGRDYYVALDTRRVRLWIFRERVTPHHWFLHGMFG